MGPIGLIRPIDRSAQALRRRPCGRRRRVCPARGSRCRPRRPARARRPRPQLPAARRLDRRMLHLDGPDAQAAPRPTPPPCNHKADGRRPQRRPPPAPAPRPRRPAAAAWAHGPAAVVQPAGERLAHRPGQPLRHQHLRQVAAPSASGAAGAPCPGSRDAPHARNRSIISRKRSTRPRRIRSRAAVRGPSSGRRSSRAGAVPGRGVPR